MKQPVRSATGKAGYRVRVRVSVAISSVSSGLFEAHGHGSSVLIPLPQGLEIVAACVMALVVAAVRTTAPAPRGHETLRLLQSGNGGGVLLISVSFLLLEKGTLTPQL